MSKIFSRNALQAAFKPFIAFLFLIFCAAPLFAQAQSITVGPASGNDYQDLQLAIDEAEPGDTLLLQANASFTGSFYLRYKGESTQWITIRTSAPDTSLPAPGERITPAYESVMPKLVAPGQNQSALMTDAKAHHYRLVGLEILHPQGTAELTDLVFLGVPNGTVLADVPHHIVIDRNYIHGYPTTPLRRCIALNSAHTEIINSHVSDCHRLVGESHGILGWNGPGPFKIINNRVEASGINILFGGSAATITGLIPSDIEIRRNHLYKPVSWRSNTGSTKWEVKNLLELKHARRVEIDGNLMENTWADAQDGYAVLFTVYSPDTIEDVTFTNNIVRHAAFGVQFKGTNARSARITIRNNVFDDIDRVTWCGTNCAAGHFLTLNDDGVDGLTVDHNTVFHSDTIVNINGPNTSAIQTTGFVFKNNLLTHNQYGFKSSYYGEGDATINNIFPGHLLQRNVLAGANPNLFTTNSCPSPLNCYPSSINNALFVDRANGDYRLASNSPYKNQGTDGKDIGCDINAMNAAINAPAQTPYATTPVSIPATIEAENFDHGGESVAYHDLDGGNNGGVYRTTDVDVRAASGASNGHVLFNAYPGEWLEYSIQVPTAGTYQLEASVASRLAGGTFHMEVDGVNVTGALQAPTTGSWYTFQTVSKNGVSLTAGTHVLRLVLDTAGVEGIVADFDTLAIVAGTPVSTPYTGTPIALPGAIPVENFDNGGEGLAYHDLTSGNSSSSTYRSTDVDMYADTVLTLQTGEWLKYTVDVGATAGTYAIVAQVGSDTAGGTFHVEVDGVDVTGIMSIPLTGSWTNWQSAIKTGVSLNAGQRVVRIVIDNGAGFNSFKSLRIVNAATSPTPYSGTAASMPGTISALDFDNGGEMVAYHDITVGCTGYCPSRNTDVDTYSNVVLRAFGGEWLKYTVNITAAGTYTLSLDVGASVTGQTFHVEFDGVDVTGPLTVPNTGSWSTFQTVTKTGVSLTSGQKVMRVVIDGSSPADGSFGVSLNTVTLQ
ncbi:MAG TPA: carbohydrate-binding protein [Pyrinomonadaceae bacterium]